MSLSENCGFFFKKMLFEGLLNWLLYCVVSKDKHRKFSLLAKFNSCFCLIFMTSFTLSKLLDNCCQACRRVSILKWFRNRSKSYIGCMKQSNKCIFPTFPTKLSVVFNVHIGPDLILMHQSERMKSITWFICPLLY